MIFHLLALAADCKDAVTSKTQQKILMENFMTISEADTLAFDECDTRHIRCDANGLVEGIFADKSKSRPKNRKIFDMQWAPPHAKFIHFRGITLASKVCSANLPRELRYLFLDRVMQIHQVYPEFAFDLKNLPIRMEELIITGGVLRGPVVLTQLPAKLRILMLNTAQNRMKTNVMVDFSVLPSVLQIAYITSFSSEQSVRIQNAGDTQADDRVRVGRTLSLYRSVSLQEMAKARSTYFSEYEELSAMCFYLEKSGDMHER